MATASRSPLASSVEKTNGNKLSRLLIDGGTTVLRDAFDRYHPPAKLAADLNSNYSILNNLLRKRILNRHQWDKLFPPGGAVPDSNTFDITLLFLLLTTICGLSPPPSGWHAKPSLGDNSLEANLARVKFFRNELYGHVTSSGVEKARFSSLWQNISTVLISLGLDQAEVDRLKTEHGGEEDYLDVLIEWADSEEDIKTQLKDIRQSQTMAEKTIGEVHKTQLKLKKELSQALNKTQEFQESFSLLEGVRESQSKTKQDVGEIRESIREVKLEVKNLAKKRLEQADEELKTLVKSEFRGDIEYHAQKFQEGTRQWVFKSIETWLDDRRSPHRVMVISGNAGMGKTVLSAVVSQRTQKDGRLAGSHFCQHNNSRYRDPRLMLQSLACHLSHAMPDYKDKLVEQLSRNLGKDLNSMGVEELFALLLKEPLSTVDDPGINSLIVIDGLDESEYQGRNELLNVIRNHFSLLPVWIRILITTRPQRKITEALRHLEPIELEQKQEENLKDIQLLFEMQLSHKIGEHRQVVLKELVKKSEGLFIYAYFLVDFIQKNMSSLTLDQLKSVLPSGISSVYLSYFKRLENELCKELELNAENELFLRFLCALTASREPLPVEFIAKILNQGTERSLPDHQNVNKAIASISTLLPVRECHLHFFHKSIKDWLVGSSPYGQHDFTVDEKEGHDVLSNLCTSELDSIKQKGVHGRQFTNTEIYALHHATQHILEVNSHDWADSSGNSSDKVHRLYKYVTDLELIYAKLRVKSTSVTEDLLSINIRSQNSRFLNKQRILVVTSLLNFLRKHSYILLDHPHLFFQCLINEGIPKLSSRAAGILDSTLKIPYMRNLDKDEHKGADLAKFYCSDKVACFNVSPEMDYLVCECRDETIHLFSLRTGNNIWIRPSLTKRDYCSMYAYGSGAYRKIGHFLSFYHSVAFHPNGRSVLPGTLRYVYTITGEREDLFPESDCTFSNCVLRSSENVIFTHCPAESKQIAIWDMANGKKLNCISRDKEISSFAVSEDCSLLAISEVTRIITILKLREQVGMRLLPRGNNHRVCGLMEFTSDNNTLACGFLRYECDEVQCYLSFLRGQGNPEFTFIKPLNNLTQPMTGSCLEPRKIRRFVLWPSVPPNTLTECNFKGQDDSSCWVSQVQKEIPYLVSGSYVRLNDETLLIGSPEHKYVTMLNVGLLRSKSESKHTSNRVMDIRKIVFSIEGDTIYSIRSHEFVRPDTPVIVDAWRMSNREILKTITFSSPVSIVPTTSGVVLFKDRVAELWNFELSECIRRIVKLTRNTSILSRVDMLPVLNDHKLIAFFYPMNSRESIYIRSSQNLEEKVASFDVLFCPLTWPDMQEYRIDFVDVSSIGGKLVSSLRIRAYAKEYIGYISCSSLCEVLVCSCSDKFAGSVEEVEVKVSLLDKSSIKWERVTEYYNLTCLDARMIFSPKNEFVVMWNILEERRGLHILNADNGETVRVFLGDQKDIVDCKFLDEESLACCSGDNFLRLFNVRTGDLLSVLDIGEKPFSLGACLYQPLVAIGLSGTRIKFVHVQWPTVGAKKKPSSKCVLS